MRYDPELMSEPVHCESCGRPMSAAAARCPHCAAVQSRAQVIAPKPVANPADPKPVLRDVSSEEARALLAISDVRGGFVDDHDDEPGLFAALLLPHPRSAGPAWAAEVVLTLIALPLIISSMLGAFFAWRSMRTADRAMERGLAPRLFAIATGTGVLSSVDLFTSADAHVGVWLIGTGWAALLARAGVRSYVRGRKRAPDLTR